MTCALCRAAVQSQAVNYSLQQTIASLLAKQAEVQQKQGRLEGTRACVCVCHMRVADSLLHFCFNGSAPLILLARNVIPLSPQPLR